MRNASLLGSWVRRFLMEHMVSERNLARNTQRSYRDTLRLLLPAVARRARKPIDRLAVTDVTADRVRQFLNDLEEKRGALSPHATSVWLRSTLWQGSSAYTLRSWSSGAEKSGRYRSKGHRGRWSRTWRRRRWMPCSKHQT